MSAARRKPKPTGKSKLSGKATKRYSWRGGSRYPAKLAPVVGRVLDEIEEEYGSDETDVLIEGLLARAKKRGSPLKRLFTWDADTALERVQRDEANRIISHIDVTIVIVETRTKKSDPDVVFKGRARVRNRGGETGKARATSASKVAADDIMRTRVLEDLVHEADDWMRRAQLYGGKLDGLAKTMRSATTKLRSQLKDPPQEDD